MSSGIYCLKNNINNKVYIGSTHDFVKRKSKHFTNLRKNKHENYHLQSAFNKYGEDNFTFYILEYVDDSSELLSVEQWWLDSCEPEYNILKIAGSPLGVKHSELTKRKIGDGNRGKVYSDETKEKIRQAKLGTKHTVETITKCYTTPFVPIQQIDLLSGEVLNSFESIRSASRITGVNPGSITNCCKNKTKSAGGFKWQYISMKQ